MTGDGPSDPSAASQQHADDDGVGTASRRFAIAIVAMGGQGGGVLSDWLVALAESQDWLVQATSVPGVAQRTGATIYYVELAEPDPDGREPVMALMPVGGDVDLVIAAEWMEAGRAIQRGLVTPDRTVLVASTHRAYATAEKIVPGNGIADSSAVERAARTAAKRLVAFDMAALADERGSVISASLFGAVAGSGALPFERSAFEDAIRAGGVGVKASLEAFDAAFERARRASDAIEASLDAGDEAANAETSDGAPAMADASPDVTTQAATGAATDPATDPATDATPMPLRGPLAARLRDALPAPAWAFAAEGVRRCVDYQDADYAREYLARLEPFGRLEGNHHELCAETARWLALRMCYEDTIRVADLKTRGARFSDIRREVRAADDQILHHGEFLHPRLQEIADTLPSPWGDRLLGSPRLSRWVERRVGNGQVLDTSRLFGFIVLHLLGRRRGWRRRTSRHARESRAIDQWLARALAVAPTNPGLALGIVKSARVIKGYGDTHARSLALFDRLLGVAEGLRARDDAGRIMDYLIDAALADAEGRKLDAALGELGDAMRVSAQRQPSAA